MKIKETLEKIYTRYNQKIYIEPDPLQFVLEYRDSRDREIAGLIGASLAYGRVELINRAVGSVLSVMGDSPFSYVTRTDKNCISKDFSDFSYRFTRAEHITALILGIQRVIREYGSLEACFLAGYSGDDDNIIPALTHFMGEISNHCPIGHLCADPSKKSACKRNHLFLRWMVRSDPVDPGVWTGISPSKLVIPLDTHMFAIGRILGFTRKKSASIHTALEVTRGFRQICPKTL